MRYPKYMAKRRNIQKQLLRFLKIIKEQKKQIYHKQNAILQHKQIKKNIYMF
jgi:preprotein translocase subunit SecA